MFELPGGVDDRVHLCSVDAVETAHAHGHGAYTALCGDEVLAGSVASKTENMCAACFAQPHRRAGRQEHQQQRRGRAA